MPQTNDKTQIRSDPYALARWVTMLLVVLAHVLRMYTGYGAIRFPRVKYLADLCEVIYTFHMPLFFCISGAVYRRCIDAGKYTSYFSFLLNKCRRLLVPYLIWGVLVVAPVVTYLNVVGSDFFTYVRQGILLGRDSRHLWFLTVLFLYFVLIGLLRPLLLRYRAAALVLFALSLALSWGTTIANLHLPAEFSLHSAIRDFCYFTLGVALASYPSAERALLGKRRWAVIFCAAFCALTLLHYSPWKCTCADLVVPFCGIAAVLSLCGLLAPYLCKTAAFRVLYPDAMGIYLAHPMIVYVLFYLILRFVPQLDPYLASVGVFVSALALSFGVSRLIRYVRLGFLTGE